MVMAVTGAFFFFLSKTVLELQLFLTVAVGFEDPATWSGRREEGELWIDPGGVGEVHKHLKRN